MARRPLEIARLIVEVTSYITIKLHRYCCSVPRLCHFSNYLLRTPAVFYNLNWQWLAQRVFANGELY